MLKKGLKDVTLATFVRKTKYGKQCRLVWS